VDPHNCAEPYQYFSHIFAPVPGDMGAMKGPVLRFASLDEAKAHFTVEFERTTGIPFELRRNPFPHVDIRKESRMRIYGIGGPVDRYPEQSTGKISIGIIFPLLK